MNSGKVLREALNNAASLYFNLQYNFASLGVLDESRTILEQTVPIVQAQLESGGAGQANLLRALSQLELLKLRARNALNLLRGNFLGFGRHARPFGQRTVAIAGARRPSRCPADGSRPDCGCEGAETRGPRRPDRTRAYAWHAAARGDDDAAAWSLSDEPSLELRRCGGRSGPRHDDHVPGNDKR